MAVRVAAFLIALLAAGALLFPEFTTATIGAATTASLSVLGRPVLLLSTAFVLACALLLVGPWGRLRLGRADEAPEFGVFSWLAMLFAAGMGSGLVFWGVAEPLLHVAHPPIGGLPADERLPLALGVTYFHWGLHAWAIYALAGLVVAWFSYRYAAPETPAGALQHGLRGWLPDRALLRLGALADALAIAAVVFGVAAALANGTLLVRNGLENALGRSLPAAATLAPVLGALALAFLASASSGIRRGILWLSVINVLLALGLLLAVLSLSDVDAVLEALGEGTAAYVRLLPAWSLRPALVDGSYQWSSDWTMTYLYWWIAWAPFVGIFIARISRGRSIREYMLGVIAVPVLFSMVWFAVMGGGAHAWDAAHGGVLADAVRADYTEPLFLWLTAIAGGGGWAVALNVTACVLLFIFLVTSADSASYVLGMLGSGGNPDPSNRSKLTWGSLTVALAAGLLARESPDVNRTVAIAGAIPYAVLLLLQVIAFGRSILRREGR